MGVGIAKKGIELSTLHLQDRCASHRTLQQPCERAITTERGGSSIYFFGGTLSAFCGVLRHVMNKSLIVIIRTINTCPFRWHSIEPLVGML